jgi:uncharacterized protein
MSRRTGRGIILLLLAYASFCILAGVYITNGTLNPQRRPLPQDASTAESVSHAFGADPQELSIRSSDGLVLRGWSVRPNNPNGDVVLLLHGLSDNRLGMIGYAQILLTQGYSIVMPDSRAHGESEGTLATYGLLERDDIRLWVQNIKTHDRPRCVFGFGESMGAAQILQSLATDTDFCAVAAESSFASFREIAYDRVGQYFHTGPWLGRTLLRPLVETAFYYAKYKYGFDFTKVSPQNAVEATKIPVLLIHGEDDSNIPIRHSQLIEATNPQVRLWEVPNTEHGGAIATHSNEFRTELLNWFASHRATSVQGFSNPKGVNSKAVAQ